MKFDWPTSPAIRSSELWKSHEWVRKVNASEFNRRAPVDDSCRHDRVNAKFEFAKFGSVRTYLSFRGKHQIIVFIVFELFEKHNSFWVY